MPYLLFFIAMFVCLHLLYKKASSTALDPGLILIFVIFFSVTANIFFYEILLAGFNQNGWVLWESKQSIQNIVLLNVLFSVTFTFFYLSFISLQTNTPENISIDRYKSQYNPIYWVLVYLILFVIGKVLQVLNQTYILTYWNNVIDLSFLISLGAILLRIKGIKLTFLCLMTFILFSMFIYYPIIVGSGEDGYAINKGGVVRMLIFCLVFLSLTKYRFLLVTPRRTIIGLIFLPFFLGLANAVENFIASGELSIITMFIYGLSGYEFQMMENQAIMMQDFNNGDLELRYGQTYLRALYDIFVPTSSWLPPNEWFAEQMNTIRLRGEEGAGYAFSFIAEGLLNFGIIGVPISAFIAAVLLSCLRLMYGIKSFLKPTIASALVILPFYVYRADFNDVIKRVEFFAISLFIVIFFYFSVKYLLGKGRVTSN